MLRPAGVGVALVLLLTIPVAAQQLFTTCSEPAPPLDSPAWLDEMPQPMDTPVAIEDVAIPVPGVGPVSARVYRPTAFAGLLPTILNISLTWSISGGKELEEAGLFDATEQGTAAPDCFGPFFLRRGYAVVLADMVGSHESGGCLDIGGPRDQAAGYAVVEWIADQDWSNGSVGMHGLSFDGLTQYATAVAGPPALRAIAPSSATFYYELAHPGAVLSEWAFTSVIDIAEDTPLPIDARAPGFLERLSSNLCVPDYPSHVVSLDGTKDEYWRARDFVSKAGSIQAAVLHAVGSHYDNVRGFGQMWQALEAHGVPRKAVVGPWPHGWPRIEGWLFIELRWFEHWVHENDTGIMAEPTMTLLDQDRVERSAESFPAPNLTLFAGQGRLAPSVEAATASYTDVPGLPHVLLADAEGARLVYRTDLLDGPVRVSGTPSFELAASIDTTDTNFAAYVYDVDAAGSRSFVTFGYLDARHRASIEEPGVDVVPGEVENYTIELSTTEHTVAAGHRIELILSSSDECLATSLFLSEECGQAYGMVSDLVPATVTVQEGPSLTRLLLPTATV